MGGRKRCYANGIVEFESSRLLQDWWLSNNIFCRSEDSVAKPLFLPPHFRGLECFLCFTRGFAAGGFGYAYAHPGRGSTPGYCLPPAGGFGCACAHPGRGFKNSLRPEGAGNSESRSGTAAP